MENINNIGIPATIINEGAIPTFTAEPTPIVATIPVSLGKLLNKPSEYNGRDRNACHTFVAQTKLYISGNISVFPDEESKGLFATLRCNIPSRESFPMVRT